jgi:hypothetical protein
MSKARFQVLVRFQSDHRSVHPTPGFENTPPLTYDHRSAAGASRRLASLIVGRAKWVPTSARCGKHFLIHDRENGCTHSLNHFRDIHGL